MKIGIVGAGPAGMMAAYTASKNGADVTVFDKNEKCGKKLYITGKGRCNLTNYCEVSEFLQNVVRGGKFLMSAINRFSPFDAYNFFEKYLPLKIERGNRVFPQSDKSSDIIQAFNKLLTESGAAVKLSDSVLNIAKSGSSFLIDTLKNQYVFDKVIIACGGESYKETGSTGDGYKFAKKLGHNIIDTVPALVPMVLEKTYIENLAGLSLKNVTASVKYGRQTFSEFGEMLFTHNGVSGPIILSLSSKINRLKLDGLYLSVDFKPALDVKTLEERVKKDLDKYKLKQFKNSLFDLLPKNLVPNFIEYVKIDNDKESSFITAQERQKIVLSLKDFKLKILSLEDIGQAIVTSGGVDVNEINPKSMESRLLQNLYFCGEVLDCDALTGGFNMQIALSTGYCAGYFSATKL